jgi:hypothetical protein
MLSGFPRSVLRANNCTARSGHLVRDAERPTWEPRLQRPPNLAGPILWPAGNGTLRMALAPLPLVVLGAVIVRSGHGDEPLDGP